MTKSFADGSSIKCQRYRDGGRKRIFQHNYCLSRPEEKHKENEGQDEGKDVIKFAHARTAKGHHQFPGGTEVSQIRRDVQRMLGADEARFAYLEAKARGRGRSIDSQFIFEK